MGLFSRDRDEPAAVAAPPAAPVAPPHPVLASVETFRDADLRDTAAALLLLAFPDGERAGTQVASAVVTLRVQELLGPATGLKGTKLLQHLQEHDFPLVQAESIDALHRSLLVDVWYGGNSSATLTLTRRGRRALDSGAVERWVDVPADPV